MQNRHILAICLDCGDTLADESTEAKDERGVTLKADLIPGAADMVRAIKLPACAGCRWPHWHL